MQVRVISKNTMLGSREELSRQLNRIRRGLGKTIKVDGPQVGRAVEVRRDLSYLITPEALKFFTEKNEDDFDYSDEWRELEDDRAY